MFTFIQNVLSLGVHHHENFNFNNSINFMDEEQHCINTSMKHMFEEHENFFSIFFIKISCMGRLQESYGFLQRTLSSELQKLALSSEWHVFLCNT